MKKPSKKVLAIAIGAVVGVGSLCVGGFLFLTQEPPRPPIVYVEPVESELEVVEEEVEEVEVLESDPELEEVVEEEEDFESIPIKPISEIEISSAAKEYIRHSKDIVLQNIRFKALEARSKADALAPETMPVVPTIEVTPAEQYQEDQSFQTVSTLDQLNLKSVINVGSYKEATLTYGYEVIPASEGAWVGGTVQVVAIRENSVILREGSRHVTRYVSSSEPLVGSNPNASGY